MVKKVYGESAVMPSVPSLCSRRMAATASPLITRTPSTVPSPQIAMPSLARSRGRMSSLPMVTR